MSLRRWAASGWLTWIGGGLSLLVHGALGLSLSRVDPPSAPPARLDPVQIHVLDAPPPKPRPTPAAEPEPTRPHRSDTARALPRAPQPASPEPPEAPPAKAEAEPAEEPLKLSGVTLTNPGGSWATRGGDGSARAGPIRSSRPGRRAARAAPKPLPKAPAVSVPVVPAADLARPPSPPALDAALRRHYPEELRRRGQGGQAVVRARIDPDGRVRSSSVLSESDPGFGAACRSTVLGSRWSPPLDREGRPVATYVRYVCRFSVDS